MLYQRTWCVRPAAIFNAFASQRSGLHGRGLRHRVRRQAFALSIERTHTIKLVMALGTGLIFGLDLIAGGMTDPSKVQGFLDLFAAWDPSLALAMAGAISVGAIGFALARKQKHARRGEAMEFPTARHIDLGWFCTTKGSALGLRPGHRHSQVRCTDFRAHRGRGKVGRQSGGV